MRKVKSNKYNKGGYIGSIQWSPTSAASTSNGMKLLLGFTPPPLPTGTSSSGKNILGGISGAAGGALKGITGIAGALAGLMKLEDTSKIEGSIDQLNNTQINGSTNDLIMDLFKQTESIDNIHYRDLLGSKGSNAMKGLGAVASGASAGASIGGPWGALIGGAVGGIGSIFTARAKKRKAKRTANKLNLLINEANQGIRDKLQNSAEGLETSSSLNAMANIQANGGMLTTFDNGGTHEENPLGGIPQGIGSNGKPNLVEEGETRYDNFVFSDRIYADGGQLRDAGIKGKSGSMAEISKKINKDLKERPNDIISKNTASTSLDRLSLLQESIKELDMAKNNKYKSGGFLSKAEGLMRYAPVVGSGIASLTDAFGVTNKPDYELANDIAKSYNSVKAQLLSDKMNYNPLDTEYTKNQLRSVSAANNRAIESSAGGNRGAAMAGLLSSNYNTIKGLGDLTRQATEYNDQLRKQVADFNRATNMYNAQALDKADMINSEMKTKTLLASAEAKHRAKMEAKAARSANLNNFLTNIGGVGKEAIMRQMISSNPGLAYTLGRDGSIKFKKD